MIDVTMIGTGALQPLPDRALSSAALTVDGRSILFDCGEGTQSAARKAGVSLVKIDIIALTHYHGDHIFGLPGLLQSMGTAGRAEPVCILGPAGIEQALEPFRMLCPQLPFEIKLEEMNETTLKAQELVPNWPCEAQISAFATDHSMPSQGYRFDLLRPGRFLPENALRLSVPVNLWGKLQRGEAVQVNGQTITPEQVTSAPRRGLSVVFTGDTRVCDAIAQAAQDVDLLICDATYGEEEKSALAHERGHMTFMQAARTAAQSGVRALWLTHYSPAIKQPEAYAAGARQIFAQTYCTEDGMKTTLCFEKRKD